MLSKGDASDLEEQTHSEVDNGLSDGCDDVELSDSTSSEDFDSDNSTCSSMQLLSEENFIPCLEAPMSQNECSLAIVSIAAKHNISYSCVTDFLRLLTQLVPNSNVIPKSHHMLMKQFVEYHASTTLYHCCGLCTQLLPSPEVQCLRSQCRNAKMSHSTFITVDINKQLELLFSGKLYCNCKIAI